MHSMGYGGGLRLQEDLCPMLGHEPEIGKYRVIRKMQSFAFVGAEVNLDAV